MLEDLKRMQEHNHKILAKVTELEREAFENLENVELFTELIQKIEVLQKQYKRK